MLSSDDSATEGTNDGTPRGGPASGSSPATTTPEVAVPDRWPAGSLLLDRRSTVRVPCVGIRRRATDGNAHGRLGALERLEHVTRALAASRTIDERPPPSLLRNRARSIPG